MPTNGRTPPLSPGWFGVALQGLSMLALSDGICPSASLAGRVHKHAVFLRRVFALLVRAHLVEAREGRDGGYRLARPAGEITLADVYRALKTTDPLPLAPLDDAVDCLYSASMRVALDEIVQEAEQRVIDSLEGHTLADFMQRAHLIEAHRALEATSA